QQPLPDRSAARLFFFVGCISGAALAARRTGCRSIEPEVYRYRHLSRTRHARQGPGADCAIAAAVVVSSRVLAQVVDVRRCGDCSSRAMVCRSLPAKWICVHSGFPSKATFRAAVFRISATCPTLVLLLPGTAGGHFPLDSAAGLVPSAR